VRETERDVNMALLCVSERDRERCQHGFAMCELRVKSLLSFEVFAYSEAYWHRLPICVQVEMQC
jgi:hypothetical protein